MKSVVIMQAQAVICISKCYIHSYNVFIYYFLFLHFKDGFVHQENAHRNSHKFELHIFKSYSRPVDGSDGIIKVSKLAFDKKMDF